MPMPNRNFGCEFEFSTKFEESKIIIEPIIEKVYGINFLYAKFQYFLSKDDIQWHLKSDSTTECELTTPISPQNDLKKICRVVEKLNKSKLKITKKDAFHVHIALNETKSNNVIMTWILFEKTILKLFPPKRRRSIYCARFVKQTAKNSVADFFLESFENSTQHHSIVSTKYTETRNTIEFRIAEGTIDPIFVYSWVKICNYLLEYANKINITDVLCHKLSEEISVEEMIKMLKIKEKKVKNWIMERHRKFCYV